VIFLSVERVCAVEQHELSRNVTGSDVQDHPYSIDEDTGVDAVHTEAALLDIIQDAVLMYDSQYRLSFWSRQAENLYGWTAQEAIGRDLRELFQEQIIKENAPRERRIFQDEGVWEAELMLKAKEGRTVIVESHARLLRSNKRHLALEAHHDVTMQKQREELRAEYYQGVQKAIDIGVWRWEISRNKQGQLYARGIINSSVAHYLKLPSNTLLTEEQFFTFVHPDDRPSVRKIFERVIETGCDYNAVYRMLDPELGTRWVASRGSVVTDQQGMPRYAIGITLDITEQKRIEEALQIANHRITSILEQVADGCIHIDKEWRYSYISRSTEKMAGINRESFLGHSVWEVRPPLCGDEGERFLRLARETQQPIQYEMFYAPARQWWEVHVYPSSDRLAFYYHNITALKQIESLYREQEETFRRLYDANLVAVASCNEANDILDANDAFLSLIGATREELQAGQLNFHTLTPQEYAALDREKQVETKVVGVCSPYEKEYYHKQGHRVPVLAAVAYMEKTKHYISIILDLTRQKELEKQREVFLGIISHELRTPLTAIGGTLQLAQRRLKRFGVQSGLTDPKATELLQNTEHLLEQALRQTRVQNRLIEDLLDASRIAVDKLELHMTETDLRSLVRETVDDLRATAFEHNIELILPEKPVPVCVDSMRIAQVIGNYITNALKYSPRQMPVTVELTADEHEARVWVHDRGPGLSEEAKQKIWSRFQRAADAREHSRLGANLGLGLYISQSLVQRHQGRVGVESEQGKGASFWFSLPLRTSCS
jgi:PAS domain S-box-containing protein